MALVLQAPPPENRSAELAAAKYPGIRTSARERQTAQSIPDLTTRESAQLTDLCLAATEQAERYGWLVLVAVMFDEVFNDSDGFC